MTTHGRSLARPGLDFEGIPHPNDGAAREGRPPLKYSKELHEKIVTLIRSGFTGEHVAAACGITKQTFAEWLYKGQNGDVWLQDFAADVDAAMSMAALKGEQVILDAVAPVEGTCPECGSLNIKDKLARAEFELKIRERRDPKHWNKQQSIIIKNELDSFLDDCQRLLPAKTYATILQIAAARSTNVTNDGETDEE